MPRTAKQYAEELQGVWDRADAEGRDLTPGERAHVEQLIESAKSMQRIEQEMRDLGGSGSSFVTRMDPNWSNTTGGPGDRFIASKAYQKIADPSGRGQSWSTGPVEVSSGPLMQRMPASNAFEMYKGTLVESGVGGPGGGLVPPYFEPGVVSKLFEPLGVSEVFGSSQTSASQVRYVVEGTALSGAAGVAEAAAKPESTLNMSETTEAIRKIATVLPVSDELLEDAPSIQSYLNGRLSLFISIEEERQLLRGLGAGSNELLGVFGRSGINLYTKLATDDNAVALARVIANTRGSSFLQPDTVIMHPTNWLNTRLLRDGTGGTVGNFYGGGPFGAAYGGGPGIGPALFGESLWNTRVVLSSVVGAGTALVGNFSLGAHIWRRGGISLEATNSHSDLFVKNISVLRGEERLGLGVYRPSAFTAVSGLA
jgi:HK97 family phage major capsid protein